MSPYLMCPKYCEDCPFVKDCYEKILFDYEVYVIPADPVFEDLSLHSEEEG